MIKNILAKTRELKKMLEEKELNLDPIDIMEGVRKYFGQEWIETDIPTYYRNTYKPNKHYEDFNN